MRGQVWIPLAGAALLALGCGGTSAPPAANHEPIHPHDPTVPPPKIHAPPSVLAMDLYGPALGAPTDVYDLSVDAGGNLWVAAQQGLHVRVAGQSFFRVLGADDGLPRAMPRAVAGLGDGVAVVSWDAAPAAVVRLDPGGSVAAVEEPPIAPLIARIRPYDGPDGRIAYAGAGASVVALDADGAVAGDRLLPEPVEAWALALVPGGDLWLGNRLGLQRLRGPIHPKLGGTFLSTPDLVAGEDDDIVAIDACPNGDLWVSALGNGVYHLDPGGAVVEHLTREEVLPQDHVPSVACDVDGSVWFGTSWGGLAHRTPAGSFAYYTATAGLPGDSIRRLVVQRLPGGGRTLWIATDGGIASNTATP